MAMSLDDVLPDPKDLDTPIFSGDQIRERWPLTREELLTFARRLERSGATITAEQLRLAVMLASQSYRQLWEG